MRIHGRLVERGGHAVDQVIAGCVLQAFGLIVDFVPRIAEDAREKRLDHPMAAQCPERDALARFVSRTPRYGSCLSSP